MEVDRLKKVYSLLEHGLKKKAAILANCRLSNFLTTTNEEVAKHRIKCVIETQRLALNTASYTLFQMEQI